MLKAVLFDLDGTLLDTAADFTNVLNAMLAARNRPQQTYTRVRENVSNGARAVVRLGFDAPEGSTEFAALLEEFLDRYANNLAEHTTLFPGMANVLRDLDCWGLRWGIVTNKPARFTTPLLAALELDKRCATAVCPDHVQRRKPDPEPMLLACEQLDIEPDQALYVGDHLRDIEAGRAAGMATVACRYGYVSADENIADWRANYIIDQPTELADIVAALLASDRTE